MPGSACWYNLTSIYGTPGTTELLGFVIPVRHDLPLEELDSRGLRLGINLASSPSPGDFLDPAPTLGESSVCLLPPGAGASPTAWQSVGRPTLDGAVDLITGLPLVKVTDLELPFGGATFRLTRTRSGEHSWNENPWRTAWHPSTSDNWWDWTGQGWMVGENPILLLDSTMPDVVGNNPRTSRLVLDAHRSIPFQQIESTGEYEAPPRFRARIRHNGEWGVLSGGVYGWVHRPTQYVVHLYGDQLKYTFVAIWEDLPKNRWNKDYVEQSGTADWAISSIHDRPLLSNQFHEANSGDLRETHNPYEQSINPGFGLPHYAICVRIEDTFGHRVEIEYCDSRRAALDDPATGDCIECRQECLAKGQIKYVKLQSRSGTGWATHWTLLYAHRLFGFSRSDALHGPIGIHDGFVRTLYPEAETTPGYAEIYSLFGTIAIDRIYVYPGDISAALLEPACLKIPHLDAPGLDGGLEPLDAYNGTAGANAIRTNWLYQVRYHYEFDTWYSETLDRPLPPPMLLKTSVRTRAQADVQTDPPTSTRPESVRNTVFHYTETSNPEFTLPWLESVFLDDDIGRLLESRATLGLPSGFDLTALATRRIPGMYSEHWARVQNFASLALSPTPYQSWVDSASADHPPSGKMLTDGYVRNMVAGRLGHAGDSSTVGVVSIRDAAGALRNYRIHRLAVYPDPLDFPGGHPFEPNMANYQAEMRPMRSIFAHPFMWNGYGHPARSWAYSTITSPKAVNWAEARWIAIVDEFADRDEMLSNYVGYDAATTTRPGQLSRRVVEMNPIGYIMRDRKWEYTAGGVVTSGGGLGEQYIYTTVEAYFAGTSQALPLHPKDDEDPNNDQDPDPVAHLRRELLLKEHRSVGWSVVEETSQAASEGLISFYQYEISGSSGTPWDERHVRTVAEGVKKGTAGAPLFTRQVFFDAVVPTQTICVLEFLEPQTALETSMPEIGPRAGSLGPPPWSATHTIAFRADEPNLPPEEQAVVGRMTVGPPRQPRPGSDWYFPVEREFYEGGNPVWSATGLVSDPLLPYTAGSGDPMASLTFTYYERESFGRSTYTVIDAIPGAFNGPEGPNPGLVQVPAFPDAQWQRIPPAPSPSAHTPFITHFRYDGTNLSDVFFPNGRQWARRWIPVDHDDDEETPDRAREFIFNDLQPVEGSNYTLFVAMSPGEVKDYAQREPRGQAMHTRRVEFTEHIDLNLNSADLPEYDVLWGIQLALDANGRVARAELLEPNHLGALLPVGSKAYNDLGEVVREEELDGTITRRTRNSLGQFLRTYVGTDDSDSDLTPPGPNNMVLVGRNEYGGGVTNAWLPTVSRAYRSNPSWAAQDYYGTPPSSDLDGYATVFGYDWRMRPVRTDSFAKGDPASSSRLSTTLTYLDHADRTRMVATYGTGAPATFAGGIEPTTLGPLDPIPTARQLYDAVPRPVTLVQMIYGPDGTMTERRTYDMAWVAPTGDPNAQPSYLAERQHAGHGGKEVFSQRPGQPLQVTRLDSLGRALSSASVLPDGPGSGEYELARTDYVYDGDGNVVETARWERVINDAVDELSTANAVRTRTVSWYDVQKRLVATADLGTEQGEYVAGPAAYQRAGPPCWSLGANDVIHIGWSCEDQPAGNPLPADVPLRLYEYDGRGNQVRTIEPSGGPGRYIVTEFEYSPTGRMTKKTENSHDANTNLRKDTLYSHQYGRLISMEAVSTNVPLAGKPQETKVVYGAHIVNAVFDVVSEHHGLIGKVRFPDETTGEPSAETDVVVLRYNFAGQVAERTDQRGVTFRYEYDALGRLEAVEVGHYSGGSFLPTYPPSMTPPSGSPVDRIGFVQYAYTSAGHLFTATTYAKRGNGSIITQNRFDTDVRGNLYREYQSYGEAINANTPHILYTWAYQPTGSLEQPGHSRLASMIYPALPGAPARTVAFSYGSANSADEQLSRLAAITTNLGVAPTIAQFGYVGTGRRESLWLAGGAIHQGLGLSSQEVGLLALDGFGRLRDLHYRDGSSGTLFRAQYGYDHAGNRLRAELTLASVNGQPRDNTHSQLNTYDNLGRLIGTDVGALVQDLSGQWSIDANTRQRTDSWSLDLLGNWVGGAAAGITGPPSPLPDSGRLTTFPSGNYTGLTHAVNATNEIMGITLDTGPSGSGGTPGQQQDETRYDNAGNLIFDGQYFYQYDAWNRLVQVNQATLDPNGGQGGAIVAGALLKHHTYDAMGRLARTQSPWPDPQSSSGKVRSERFYYDGIRRIQELVTDPVEDLKSALESEDPELQLLAMQSIEPGTDVDGDAAPMALETGQMAGGPIGGPSAPATVTYLAREYIWGPGDNSVDELLVQFDPQRLPTWPLQDAGGDIVALCDSGGSGGTAAVLAQWTYDAYGAVLTADHLYSFPQLHCGHKAMFLDRLDAGVVASGAESPRLVPYAHSVYQYRNRSYSPALGRFFQRDPNATAKVLLGSSAYHGRGMSALVAAFDLMGMYGDGANLYQYLGSSPWQRRDPLGLSYDPFSIVEDFLSEFSGSVAATLAALGQDMKAVGIVAANIASFLPFPFVGNIGDLALYALGEQSEEALAAAMAIGLVPGGKLAAKFANSGIGRFIGRVGSSAWGAAKHYAGQLGSRLARRVSGAGSARLSLFDNAREFNRRKPPSVCIGCFAAGTLVWTSVGLVPIEQVRVGDFVLAMDEATGEVEYRKVTAEIVTERAALLELSLVHQSGAAELLRTTDEHPFWVEGRGWSRTDSLVPGDVLRTNGSTATVSAVGLPSGRTTVYNLTVEGHHNYFVGRDAVWVHNCGEITRGSDGFEHSFGRHHKEWQTRWGVKVDRDEWFRILQDANRSSVEGFGSLKGTRTLVKYARIDGNKPILLHWFAEGPNAGEFATAFIPSNQQIQDFFRSLK